MMTTHEILHKMSLDVLYCDLDKMATGKISLGPYLEDKIQVNAIKAKLDDLLNDKDIFVNCASLPDKIEKHGYFELYTFIPNVGMKITGKRFAIPFSQHFYSTSTCSNYMGILGSIGERLIKSKHDFWRRCGFAIKKQGLTFNALNSFLSHSEQAVESLEQEGKITEQVVRELSMAAHYLEDMCETHHATNHVGIEKLFKRKELSRFFSNHRKFEKYARTFIEQYALSSIEYYCSISSLTDDEMQFWKEVNFYTCYLNEKYLMNRQRIESFNQLCHWYAISGNSVAQGLEFMEDAPQNPERVIWALGNDKSNWDKNIEQMSKLSQALVSGFLFHFLLYACDEHLYEFRSLK